MPQRDLEWAEELVAKTHWTWAKTFEGGAEHSYVIKSKTMAQDVYERLARTIWEFGVPQKFYKRTNIELHLPNVTAMLGSRNQVEVEGVKLWLMADKLSVSKALNIAPLTSVYGKQDAPVYGPWRESPFGRTALEWNDLLETDEALKLKALRTAVWKEVNHGERFAGRVVEFNARSGFALRSNLVRLDKDYYTAVESCRGLMNTLVAGNQWVKDVHTVTPEEYLAAESEMIDTSVSLFGAASYLKPEDIEDIAERSGRTVLMHYADDPSHDWFGPTFLPDTAPASRDRAWELADASIEMGPYVLTRIGD